jgi:tetratricopeptide (TPR) repeat protein
MPRGQSFVNVMRVGIKCAASEKQTPGAAGRMQSGPDEAHLKILQPLAEEALKVPEGFGDDKGEIYSTLIGIAKRGNNPTGAKKYATEMWVFLEEQGRVAPNPEARASLDTWRMSAASSLNDPALALPALQASERDLPTDYNPSSRLASIYAQLGRIDEALAANQRALAKTNGDRRVSAYRTRVSLLEKKGDKAEAKKTLEEAITFAETLPAPGGPATVAALKKQLEQYNKTERGS